MPLTVCWTVTPRSLRTRLSWSITECQNVGLMPVRRATRARRLWYPAKSGVAGTVVFQRDLGQKRENGELRTPSDVAFKVNWHELGSWGTDNRANG